MLYYWYKGGKDIVQYIVNMHTTVETAVQTNSQPNDTEMGGRVMKKGAEAVKLIWDLISINRSQS